MVYRSRSILSIINKIFSILLILIIRGDKYYLSHSKNQLHTPTRKRKNIDRIGVLNFQRCKKDGFVNVNVFVFKDAKSWGAALLHSTEPYLYNIRLRNLLHSAKWIKGRDEGWKLSQNGLINNEGKIENTLAERSLQKILGVTERRPNER